MSLENSQQNDCNANPDDSALENSDSFDPREYHPDLQPDRHLSTGPRTPEGKAISSQNATKHGCRSQKLILRHESPADYEALHEKWWDEYQPSDHIEETLVQQLIDSHWFFKRASLRLEQVEWEMPMNAKHWVESYRKQVETFTRYKTTAERAFRRAFREVQVYFRDCLRAENMAHKADLMRLQIEAQIARKPKEVKQIALKMAIPLYRNRRERIAARHSALTNPDSRPSPDPKPPISPPELS
jgi:hypothetical protein